MSGDPPELVRLDIPANYRHLGVVSEAIADLLGALPITERSTVIYAVQLAAHEACSNIVEHAYAGRNDGRITLTLQLYQRPPSIVIEIDDDGTLFDLGAVPNPDLDHAHVRGYGVFLIRNLMDEMTYTPQRGGNHWRLVKYLSFN
jgi:serine/threonine-protein kinase RsbW